MKEEITIKKWGRKKVTEKDYFAVMIIAVVIVLAFFIYVTFIPKSSAKEISVEIIEIVGECEDCFDVSSFENILAEKNTKIKKETLDYNSEEAKFLIEEYNIKSVPAIVILSKNIGELELDGQIFSVKEKSAVFDKSVPYIDLNSDEIKGLVNIKEVYDSNCKDCMSLSQLQESLEELGIRIENYEAIASSSLTGKKLIIKNNLNFLPNLLISKEIQEYWWVFPQIKDSFVEEENYYVFKTPLPPYKEISSGKVKGVVDITYLTNNSCEDCFNITQLKGSFQNLGIYIDNEKYIDVSSAEGKNLLEKYNITAIPTAILSEGIQDYDSIKEVLEQVGTFENNRFVFRELEELNVEYQKLE
jgi:thioredoxin-related protein